MPRGGCWRQPARTGGKLGGIKVEEMSMLKSPSGSCVDMRSGGCADSAQKAVSSCDWALGALNTLGVLKILGSSLEGG